MALEVGESGTPLKYTAIIDFTQAGKEVDKFNDKLNSLSKVNVAKDGIIDNSALVEAQKKLKDAQLANIEALRQSRLEATKQKQAQSDLNNEYLQGKITAQQYALEQRKIADAQKEAARQARETKRALMANSEYSKLASALNDVRNQAKNTLAEMARLERQGYKNGAAYQQLAQKAQVLVKESQVLDRQIKRVDATVGQHQRNVGNYSDAISMVVPQLGQFAGRLGLVAAAVAAANKSFTTNLSFDSLTTALRNVSKDSADFDTNMKFLRETTNRLGLEFTSTAQAFKLWQGAAKFANITGNESRRIFESIANAGAKMKLSSDQMQGALLAVSQMMSKGKVQAEELRGQLGERLPGAFSLAAKAMGVTEMELNKMLEKGEVIANDFLPKFATQLDKAFDNDKTKNVESLQASVNRLSNEFEKLWQSEKATGFFTAMTDGLAQFTRGINNTINSKSFKQFMAATLSLTGNDLQSAVFGNYAEALNDIDNNKTITKTDRAISKNVKGFSNLTTANQELQIAKQKEIVESRVEEYKTNSNKKNLEMLTLQNGVLAEMNKIYYSNQGPNESSKGGLAEVSKKASDKAKREAEQAAERAKKLIEDQKQAQARIDEIKEQSRRQSLSKEEQDILSIQDRYKKAWEQVAIDREKGLLVNTSGLKEAEQADIAKYNADIEAKKQEEAKRIQKEALKSMFDLSATNESKIADIRKKYSDAYEQLERNKTTITLEEYEKRKEALKKGQADEIGGILLPDLQKSGDWINVFEKNATLARTKVQQSVESLRVSLDKMLDSGEVTIEQYNDALKQISNVEIQISVNERGFGRIKQILKELKESEKGSVKYEQARQNLAEEINYWGQGLVQAGDEALNIADQLGIGSDKFKEDMALSLDLASNAVNLASSIASGDVVGMVTNGIKTISSAISLFTKDRGLERKIKEYQKQLEELGETYKKIQYQISNSVGESFYGDSQSAINNLKERQRILEQMAKAEEDKKKTDQAKVQQYRDEYNNIFREIADIEKSISEMLVQTSFKEFSSSLAEALSSAFESGEDGIESLEKTFDKFIKNALVNSLKLKMIEDPINAMLKDLTTYMQGNDNSLLGFDFEKYKNQLNGIGGQFNQALEEAYSGLGLSKDGQSSSNLKAEEGIQRLTEETGTEIVGMYRAGYDIWKRQLIALDGINNNSSNHLRIAMDKLTALNAIQTNTANTVSRLDMAVTELQEIKKALR